MSYVFLEALLEPHWAILDIPTPPGPPVQSVRGAGLGERWATPRRNRRGLGRGSALNHSRPKGLVGLFVTFLPTGRREGEEEEEEGEEEGGRRRREGGGR